MLKTYFLTSFRALLRNKSYSILNIVGLSLGIACSILLFLVIKHETSYDTFHEKGDRIYRLGINALADGEPYAETSVPVPITDLLRQNNPGLEDIVQVFTANGGQITVPGIGKEGPKHFMEEGAVGFVESDFFNMFSFDFGQQDFSKAMAEPNHLILTRSLADKYFPDSEAIGKIVKFDNKLTLKVIAVIPDLPAKTDFPFLMFIPRANLKDYMQYSIDSWGTITSQQNLYVTAQKGLDAPTITRKVNEVLKPHIPEKSSIQGFFLQPLNDIHFNEDFGNISGRTIGKKEIWAMAFIGIFLIITACINFINLATAQAIKRSKEVGMRKVLGSSYRNLILQFLGETFIITLAATLGSIILTELALPYLNKLMELEIKFSIVEDPELMLFLVLELLVVTLFAGLYPAFVLARFQPIAALKSRMSTQQVGGISLRRALVVVQFIICQTLIICTLVVSEQMEYFSKKPLGFSKDAVIILSLPVGGADKLMAYRQEIIADPAIRDVSFNLSAPSSDLVSQSSFAFNNSTESMPFSANMKYADEHYFDLFGLKMVAGRPYAKSDTVRELVINETMRRKLGLKTPEEAIGKKIQLNKWPLPIVGVVEDFHQASLHKPIDPSILTTRKMAYYHLAVKTNQSQTAAALQHLEKVWQKAYPEDVFNYKFLDESIAKFYMQEKKQFTLFRVFSFIAIVIGCLGLYGLVAFMAAQRTKEVGIRKVLGASLLDITYLFSKEFIKLVLIAFVIATPVAYYFMQNWLEDFTYRISLSIGAFLLAGVVTLTIALLTMSVQAIRAARKNPVLALKTE